MLSVAIARLVVATTLAFVCFAACAGGPPPRNPAQSFDPAADARGEFVDSLQNLVGRASLRDSAGGVRILALVQGLGSGAHAMHVHERGLCSAPFTSAGGHYNPTSKTHGLRSATGSHLGDLPDLPAADSGGVVRYVRVVPGLSVASILDADGAALVIHERADDGSTDPDGNAGRRIACALLVRVSR